MHCYALLCTGRLCHALLCAGKPCYPLPARASLAMLCVALLSFVQLCPAMRSYTLLCNAMHCYALLCQTSLVFWSPRGLGLRARRWLIWGIWGAAPMVILRSLFDFFLLKEIRQWVNRCLQRCSVLMRLLNASVSVLWANV